MVGILFHSRQAYPGPWHSTVKGEVVIVLDFFSTQREVDSDRWLIVTTTITPLGDWKSFFGGSVAQSM
jgi:hypothetical protein